MRPNESRRPRRLATALALVAALGTATACQSPGGGTDWGRTLALGAGVGLAGAALAGAVGDRNERVERRSSYAYRQPHRAPGQYGWGNHHGRPSHGYGYGRPAYAHRGGGHGGYGW